MALFGEKYGEEVRVLSMGEFSMELCGGTHVERSGDIGLFKITTETGIAAGIRRIEAITGEKALNWIEKTENELQKAADLLKVNRYELVAKLEQFLQRNREQEKQIEKLKAQMAHAQVDELIKQVVAVNDVQVLAAELPNADANILRDTVDQLKQKFDKAVIALAAVNDGKIQLVVGVTKNCTDKVKAGDIVGELAQRLGGKGGGRPDLAQGGGDKLAELQPALNEVASVVAKKLQP